MSENVNDLVQALIDSQGPGDALFIVGQEKPTEQIEGNSELADEIFETYKANFLKEEEYLAKYSLEELHAAGSEAIKKFNVWRFERLGGKM